MYLVQILLPLRDNRKEKFLAIASFITYALLGVKASAVKCFTEASA
jgi:hypothetical protein